MRRDQQIMCVFVAMLLITLSNMKVLIRLAVDDYVAYGGYAVLLLAIVSSLQQAGYPEKKKPLRFFGLCAVLLCVGLVLQDMGFFLKVRLIVTVLIFAAVSVLSFDLLTDYRAIRVAAYGVFLGVLSAMLMAALLGEDMFSRIDEGSGAFGSLGFNGGLSHKNYFAMMLFGSFSCLSVCWCNSRKTALDSFVLIIQLLLIYLSHARVVWLLTAAFLFIMAFWRIRPSQTRYRRILLVLAAPIVALAGYFLIQWLFSNYISRSMTYMARYNGLMNWFAYCGSDLRLLAFGDAASFFGTSASYYDNFRILTGSSGAVDMALVNILIKTGFVGLAGYALVFGRMLTSSFRMKSHKQRVVILALLVPMVASMLSENCVSTISISYVTLLCLSLSGLCGGCFNGAEKIGTGLFRHSPCAFCASPPTENSIQIR